MGLPLGVGIIGCGGIARAKHIPNLLKDERVRIVGVCDSAYLQRTREVIEEFSLSDCAISEDAEALIAREDVEIIHICTPNASHAQLSIQALEAGKHVMCEKPMAVSVQEAARMVEAAKKAPGLLTIAANNRFRAYCWHLKQLCEQGDLGEIYYAKAHALRRRGVPTWGSFIDRDSQGGGPVIDIGTHALDMALWLMDNYRVKSVTGSTYDFIGKQTSPANPYGNWDSKDFTVEDSGVALITMENGATVLLEASWAMNIRDEKTAQVTLCGTKSGADMDDGLTLNGEINGKLYDQKIILEPPGIPFYTQDDVFGPQLEIRCWIDAILGLRPLVTRPEQMLTVMEIIDAVYRSADIGHAVTLCKTEGGRED